MRASVCALAVVGLLGTGLLASVQSALAQGTVMVEPTTSVPRLRFAPEADYGPFVFRDVDGVVRGLSVDLLERVAVEAGVQLDLLPAQSLADILAAARRGEVDVISSLRPTPERAVWLDFSAPYAEIEAVAVGRADAPRPALERLAGRPVAVGAGYAVEAHVRARHPAVAWVAVPDDREGLRRLRAGAVDAVVLDRASLAFIATREGWQDLRIGNSVGFSYALSFAWPKTRPAVGEVLERGLQRIGPAERVALLARWLPPASMADDGRRTHLAGLALLAALVGVALLGWAYRRSRAAARGRS